MSAVIFCCIGVTTVILFFTVSIRLLTLSGLLSGLAGGASALLAPFGLTRSLAEQLLTGLLEMSSGVSALTKGPLSGRLSLAAFMLGWAGLSVHCQVMAFSGSCGLSLRSYLAG